jgi:hypothetical protein
MIIRGKDFNDSDIELIKKTISENPLMSRRKLSILIADLLDWRQPNGRLKDRAVRDVLLRLNQKGLIGLPDPAYAMPTQTAGVKRIAFQEPTSAMTGRIDDFSIPVFKVVEHDDDRRLWNYLVEKYHYKGCRIVVGRHLKYLLYLDGALIGCFAFADAVLKLNVRDQWIGWNSRQRESRLCLVVNNVRFLLLPWVRVRNLASKLLGLSAGIVAKDWQHLYHYRPLLFETFVETDRFSGASYKAANWIYLGQTRGKGRSGMRYYDHGILKDVYVYPLVDLVSLRQTLAGAL